MRRRPDYGAVARWYDAVSFEWPVYRPARGRAIAMLAPGPGARVLDLGCGTGLNFSLLRDRIGPDGYVLGLDRSPAMLTRARNRVIRHGWRNVDLRRADVTAPVLPAIEGGRPFDAAVATYALSLMGTWRRAWDRMVASVRPGGRIALVELGLPRTGGYVARRLARLACDLGGSDLHREPWRAAEADLLDVRTDERWAGHVIIRVGTVPG